MNQLSVYSKYMNQLQWLESIILGPCHAACFHAGGRGRWAQRDAHGVLAPCLEFGGGHPNRKQRVAASVNLSGARRDAYGEQGERHTHFRPRCTNVGAMDAFGMVAAAVSSPSIVGHNPGLPPHNSTFFSPSFAR